MAEFFDFIIIGAGPSGCVLASRLAHTASKPSVLLLEAGGTNDNTANLSAAERFNVAFSPNSPLNWNYKTTPQEQLAGQEIDYSRGKGLGGSTAINFCGWTVGPRDDYDEWATLVQDDSFKWSNAKRQLDKIQNLHPKIPDPTLKKYVHANGDHSTSGLVDLSYGDAWAPNLEKIFVAAEQAGLGINSDVNSGNPIGMGMGSVCIYEGQRLTASMAYLNNPPPNLKIIPHALVSKILFDNKTAVSVKTIDGRQFNTNKEIILSGGALNTPQLLMLSGIGPQEELMKHEISIVHNLALVGQNLQDHCFSPVGITLKNDRNTIGAMQSPSPMGWFKLPSLGASPEYAALPQRLQDFMKKPTVPNFEICSHTPPSFLSHEPSEDTTFLGAICLIMNPQSTGSVSLRSSSPTDIPFIQPNFLTHEFDKRVIIDGVRETMKMLGTPVFSTTTIERIGPKDDSDEAIWDHVKKTLRSSWHMSCTVRMGTSSSSACVDSNFRVFGTKALRVVDLSVCPFVPNAHTQTFAYVVGEIAAEKIINEYSLEECKPTVPMIRSKI